MREKKTRWQEGSHSHDFSYMFDEFTQEASRRELSRTHWNWGEATEGGNRAILCNMKKCGCYRPLSRNAGRGLFPRSHLREDAALATTGALPWPMHFERPPARPEKVALPWLKSECHNKWGRNAGPISHSFPARMLDLKTIHSWQLRPPDNLTFSFSLLYLCQKYSNKDMHSLHQTHFNYQ